MVGQGLTMTHSFRHSEPSERALRAALGPLATAAMILVLALGGRFGVTVPNPNLLFALALVWSAYEAGVWSGLASAALSLGWSAVAWSRPGHLFQFAADDRQRLAVAALCLPVMALLVGALKARSDRRQQVLAEFLESEKERSRLLMESLERRETPLGSIPVCAWCHRARDAGGGWESLEAYLDKQHGVAVTHGICPQCRDLFEQA